MKTAKELLSLPPLVSEGQRGPWRIAPFDVSENDAKLFNMRQTFSREIWRLIKPGSYVRLTRNGSVVMSNTPAELRDHEEAVRRATGRCFVGGLGLGLVVRAMLEKPDVELVTVLEIDPDVIRLVGDAFWHRYGDRVEILQGDVHTWKPKRRYNVAWFDVWNDICTDNLHQMGMLHRRWSRWASWYSSWCYEDTKYYKRQEYR